MNSFKINKDNFDKFYKDFEAGNLDKNRCEELFSFMEANVDWLEEETSAAKLSPLNAEILSDDFKQILLEVNFENDQITSSNIHAFLSANAEGLLSDEEVLKLSLFLQENPQFEKELKALTMLRLVADEFIKYPNKSQLKRKETRLLWPIITAAACLACLMMFNLNWDTEKMQSAAQDSTTEKRPAPAKAQASIHLNGEGLAENNRLDSFSQDYTFSISQNIPWDSLNYLNAVDSSSVIDTFDFQKDKYPEMSPEIFKVPKVLFISSNNNDHNDDQEVPVTKMNQLLAYNNPIHPITTGLSYLTHQEIDFRMQNDASNKKGRYFLKVGKLEILHIEN
jgi:hypothetical protein